MPPLGWLRSFEAAARHLSFTDAAMELNLTQAAISKHVKSLELQLRQPDDLANHRLLHVLGYQEGWGTWLRAAGAISVNSGKGLRFDTSLTAFELAAQGGGVALGRSSLATRECETRRLVAPFNLAVPVKEGFHLLQPVRKDQHRDAAPFVDWVSAAAHEGRG